MAGADQTREAMEFLSGYNSTAEREMFDDTEAQYTYDTNLTEENSEKVADADAKLAVWKAEQAAIVKAKFKDLSEVHDATAKRALKLIGIVGIKLDEADTKHYSKLLNSMTSTYSNGEICSYDTALMKQNCEIKWNLPDNLTELLAKNRDYNLLKYIWKEWRDATGKQVRSTYKSFVDLSNKGAEADGFHDMGAYWRSIYEDANFEFLLQDLWRQVLPLYEQLHTYVRRLLNKQYPKQFHTTALPGHVLGNMWAQSWVNIYDFSAPYPNQPTIDITGAMKSQGYDHMKMFQTAEKFFVSLGMIKMPEEFWKCTMMTKPVNKKVVCHASAWDFYNRKKFCIKMCANVNMEDLVTIHHEMGHIEYYLQYTTQQVQFRDGANPGFHEAIGDTIALSVSTPIHLNAIGLLPDYQPNEQQDINFLYRQALDKIAFLPYGYILDYWRWNVFNGNYTFDQWNNEWWNLRFQYQGIVPPVTRAADDFDPGGKFHVVNNVPYIRYFISNIVQFQFYKAMCQASGHTGPLHMCDFYNNANAGTLLADMLHLGSSKPWPEALKLMTGEENISAAALLEYFNPLMQWMKEQNSGHCFGWGYEWPSSWNLFQPRCKKQEFYNETERAHAWLIEYNKEARKVYHDKYWAMWKNMLDITDQNADVAAKAAAAQTKFDTIQAQAAQNFDLNKIENNAMKRELEKIRTIGIALDENDSIRFNEVINNMTSLFNNGFICNRSIPDCKNSSNPNAKWFQDPTLQVLTATSTDWDLLEYIWVGWRNVTGDKMRDLFLSYVELGNKGSQADAFSDMGDLWRSTYEDSHFKQDIETLFRQVLPLYEQMHAYVRRKLIQQYGKKIFTSAIPAHVLGNMWAQEWENLYKWTAPYPEVPSVDVTDTMIEKGWDYMKLFHEAEAFYTSIGLYNMTDCFWNVSMLVKPGNRSNVACYPDSETFYDGECFGIDMCTKVRMSDFVTIHHEMGHIEYFMAYVPQPVKFKDGANAGFHEAIGDTMALAVATPAHLHKIGLLSDDNYQPNNQKQDINFLYKQALEKIAFLPFGYLIDNYRWKIFDGSIPKDALNGGWWSLRYKYQGIVPPVPRSEKNFDAGAKYHVAGNVPYIRYFISFIIQFQFYKSLCKTAGHKGPLHKCDFYQSMAAGSQLKSTLELGSSKPWPYAMQMLAETEKMNATALIEYFQPLLDYLKQENEKNNECYGWGFEWPDYYHLAKPRCGTKLSANNGGTSNRSTIIILAVLLAVFVLIVIIFMAIWFVRYHHTNSKDVRIPLERFDSLS